MGKTIYNGRLFNPPPGEGKTHNIGSTAGQFWRHPGINYDPEKETFVTEGIINALSLIEIGHQAIAVLSAGQDPSKVDLSKFRKLVFAFDPDEAGKRALKKWMKAYPTADAVLPVRGDWNDFLTSLSPEKAKAFFQKKRGEFEVLAKLALAKDAYTYAAISQEFYQRAPGLFAFDGCLYFSSFKKTTAGDVLITEKVSNFTLNVRYYQLDTTNPEEPVNRFFLDISPRKGLSTTCSVTAQELASSNSLTTMFLQRSRSLWEGERAASLALARMIVNAGAPVVRQLQTVGYDLESNCFVFKHFLIDPKGAVVLPNSFGFFEISRTINIQPAPHPTLKPVKAISPKEVWILIFLAWGPKGLVALIWVVAGWWVNQIKAKIGFFPFLSLWDDSQTGKTWLTKILNAVQALDEEGLPMTKVNTSKGEIRKLAQRSGLFKGLLEANKTENVRFDVETILPLYNVNPLQTSALKTNDSQTKELPFLASLLFVQNKEPFKTKPQKERVISLRFKKEDISPETSAAFHKLTQIPIAELGNFFIEIMSQRHKIESEWYDEYVKAKKELYSKIPDNRLNENHALILAFHRLLSNIIDVNYDLKPYIEHIGQVKYNDCNKSNETIADYFFDLLLGNVINGDSINQCYKINEQDNKIYIHLGKAIKAIEKQGLPLRVQLKDLQQSLLEHPSFIESNKGNRQIGGIFQKTWIFDSQKIIGQV